MKYSFFSRIRDFGLLCIMLFLVKTALERTSTFINEHKKSIIHELDRSFLEQIYTAQHHLFVLEESCGDNDAIALEIAHLKKDLARIEEQYKTNSPAIMLLGPIGSAAIVTKEEKLQKNLIDVINKIQKLRCNLKN